MTPFTNILLLCECDRATLDRAVQLAKSNNARLTLVQVVREMSEPWRRLSRGGTPVDLQTLAINESQSRLEKIADQVKQDGVRTSTKVIVGTPFLAIIREVIANKRDLIMMTAEGKGGLQERLFGSTSLHLMRKCPCPVWIMKPARRKRFRRIVAAVDPDPTDKIRDSLNATILQLASFVAVADKAELHVLHAWTLPHESLMRGRGGFAESDIRNYANQETKRRQKALNTLLNAHTDGTATVHLTEGDPDVVIPECAKAENVDLLVMGTVCRTGIPGFFIGNTAERILDEVDCSVLTIKPEGFVSPVKLA